MSAPHSGLDASAADLVPYVLNRAVGSFNRAWLARLREHGMTVARWQVLAILSEYDGSRPGTVARMASAEQAVVSRVVDQMERDDLVVRRAAPDDGRAVEVWLTRRGRAVFDELMPEASTLVRDALAGVDDATVRVVMDALLTLVANLDGESAIELPVLPGASR